MKRSLRISLFLATAATVAAVALAGCQTNGTDLSARALTPLSGKMLADIEQKNMNKDSAILVRIFKQEAELEVWKQDRTGHFALLKSYPICRWSGELGPKVREGDRQAPEGFYSITPGQMNPKSQYYLAFNMGYPNAYDRAWSRTGAELMIHGDCSSRGCYAMTDEQIAEIYALGREAFFGGQRAFQVQAYPFRMTPANFAKHRNNPNLAFWKMLKRGNDHFEVTLREPKVDVCDKHYVFNGRAPANSSTPLAFSPAAKCPAYEVAPEILEAVNQKQRRDEYQTAELITRGVKTSPIRTGADGGMHPVFLAALQHQEEGTVDSPTRTLAILSPPPGTIPRHVVPPRTPEQLAAAAPPASSLAQPAPVSAPAHTAQKQAPPASTTRPQTASMLHSAPIALATAPRGTDTLFQKIYANAEPRAAASRNEATGAVPAAKPKTSAPPHAVARPVQTATPHPAGATRSKPAVVAETRAPVNQPASKPAQGSADASSFAPSTAPMAPTGSFESRWSAISSRGRF